MGKHFLLLLATVSTISCPFIHKEEATGVEITNNSEYDITWVVIIRRGYVESSDRGDKLIAKNGGSRFFYTYGTELIACVKAEDTPELMCVDEFKLKNEETKTFVWNGIDDPAWQPQRR